MKPILMTSSDYFHEAVLKQEVVEQLVTDRDGLYIDATVGLGGHSEAILERLSPKGKLLGFDLDPEALQLAGQRLSRFGDRARLVHENFRNLAARIEQERFKPVAGALFDLGVSSMQLDKHARGFSIKGEGPLDMRLDPGHPITAARIVNEWPEEQIELLLREFGEERDAARIAGWIVERRAQKPFQTTTDLSKLIESKIARREGVSIHPATRTFMALRIAVNRELENLTRGLEAVLPFAKPGGRVAVITFHSLEDRIAKNILKSFAHHGQCEILTPSPVRPTSVEIEKNPRSRSAKLRVVEKK